MGHYFVRAPRTNKPCLKLKHFEAILKEESKFASLSTTT